MIKHLMGLLLLLGLVSPALAQQFTFEGTVSVVGQREPITRALPMEFLLFTVPDGGRPVWREALPEVAVEAGRFTVVLGGRTPFPPAVFEGGPLFLEQVIDGQALTPRHPVTDVPRAAVARQALDVAGRDIHPRSVSIGDVLVIDEEGNWVGPGDAGGTVGPQGPPGPPGPQGPPGPAGGGGDGVDVPMLGEIRMFPGIFAPRGWAFCDGSLLPIADHMQLFSLLGTAYGGDGITTFALPDLRGRFPLGAGQGPALMERRVGDMGGEEDVTLSVQEMPAHRHELLAVDAAGDRPGPGGNLPARGAWSSFAPNAVQNAQAVQQAGGGQPHENMPPFTGVQFIIALHGVYPSRQ